MFKGFFKLIYNKNILLFAMILNFFIFMVGFAALNISLMVVAMFSLGLLYIGYTSSYEKPLE